MIKEMNADLLGELGLNPTENDGGTGPVGQRLAALPRAPAKKNGLRLRRAANPPTSQSRDQARPREIPYARQKHGTMDEKVATAEMVATAEIVATTAETRSPQQWPEKSAAAAPDQPG